MLNITANGSARFFFFKPAGVVGTNDFRFISFLVTLCVDEGHKVRGKQNLLTSFFSHFSTDRNKIFSGNKVFPVKYLYATV